MRINTYKHSYGYHCKSGSRVVYNVNGGADFYEPAPEEETMMVEYDGSKISIGPEYKIQIDGNIKDAAFGFAVFMADNIGDIRTNDSLIGKAFEINKEAGIVKSILETNDQTNDFIIAFNKVWLSVLLLG
jgi:hypothetical protein